MFTGLDLLAIRGETHLEPEKYDIGRVRFTCNLGWDLSGT